MKDLGVDCVDYCLDSCYNVDVLESKSPLKLLVIIPIGTRTIFLVLHLHDNNSVDDIGFDGVYNLELNLTHLGSDAKIIEAELGIKVLKNILKHYLKNR